MARVRLSEFGKEGRGDGGRGANPLRAELAGRQPVQELSWKWFRCWFFCSPPPCFPPSPKPHSRRKPATMSAQLCASLRWFGSLRHASGSLSPPTPMSTIQVTVPPEDGLKGVFLEVCEWTDLLLPDCRHTFLAGYVWLWFLERWQRHELQGLRYGIWGQHDTDACKQW